MAVKLIKTGGTNSNVNKDFYQYRQGQPPRRPAREMPPARKGPAK